MVTDNYNLPVIGESGSEGTTNDTIAGNTISGFQTGIQTQSVNGQNISATIGGTGAGNTITGGTTGIMVGAGTTAQIIGNTIDDPTTGVKISGTATLTDGRIADNGTGVEVASGGHATLNGVDFKGADISVANNTTDLKIDVGAASVTLELDVGMNPDAFWGDTYINNQSSLYIDATSSTFGSAMYGLVIPSSLSLNPADPATTAANLAELYPIEDRITDGLDIAGNAHGTAGAGLVRIVADDVFLAASSEAAHSGSIQRAVDLADAGPETANDDTIYVQAGTFAARIAINKAVTLLGANASADPTNGGVRGAETVIEPTLSGGDPYSSSPTFLIEVLASNVTIAGFTLTGRNDALGISDNPNAVQLTESSVYAQASEGIALFNPTGLGGDITGGDGVIDANVTPGKIVIEDNIVEDLSYQGLDLGWNTSGSVPTSGNIVSHNLIQNIGAQNDEGDGIRLRQNFYADVTDNQMLNVRMGVETGSYYLPNPGANGSIADNEIQARRRGILYNLTYGTATAMPVTGNTITATADDLTLGGSYWVGAYIVTQQGTVTPTFSDNSIDGSGSNYTTTIGYAVADTWSTADVAISGGTVKNVTDGVKFATSDPNGFTSAEQDTALTISGVSISASSYGIYVQATNSDAVALTIEDGTTITTTGASGIGVEVSGAEASPRRFLGPPHDAGPISLRWGRHDSRQFSRHPDRRWHSRGRLCHVQRQHNRPASYQRLRHGHQQRNRHRAGRQYHGYRRRRRHSHDRRRKYFHQRNHGHPGRWRQRHDRRHGRRQHAHRRDVHRHDRHRHHRRLGHDHRQRHRRHWQRRFGRRLDRRGPPPRQHADRQHGGPLCGRRR